MNYYHRICANGDPKQVAIVYIYFFIAALIFYYQIEKSRDKFNRVIQANINELETWKEFLIQRTSQPIIGTGCFQRNDIKKITTFNSFNIRNNAELIQIM